MIGSDGANSVGGFRLSAALWLLVSSLLVDMTSIGMAVAMVLQVGPNCGSTSSFDWIVSVGLVGSVASIVVTWLRYAPDGCTLRLPMHLALLVVAAVFTINVALYSDCFRNFDHLKSINSCITDSAFERIHLLIFMLMIINIYKYAAILCIELLAPRQHVWCCHAQQESTPHVPPPPQPMLALPPPQPSQLQANPQFAYPYPSYPYNPPHNPQYNPTYHHLQGTAAPLARNQAPSPAVIAI